MGACVSFSRSPTAAAASHSQRSAAATVKVVNLDGSMGKLAAPVTAREALAPIDGGRHGHRASSSPPPRLFLCSADELGYDAAPRALAAGEALQPGQLYFVLPASALRRALSANDMAALAVRAATAFAAEAGLAARAAGGMSPPRRRNKQGGTTAGKRQSTARVAPLLVAVSSKEIRSDGGHAARPAVQDDGDRTVGKTRKGAAAGYRTGGFRHRAAVQRLSAIAEDGN